MNSSSVYVIIENGEPYQNVYTLFASAVAAVKEKHVDVIDEQKCEADLDVPEDTLSGKTYLYIEKGIHIYIYKLPKN